MKISVTSEIVETDEIIRELNKKYVSIGRNKEQFQLRFPVFCLEVAQNHDLVVEIDGNGNAYFWDECFGQEKPTWISKI